MNVDQCQWPKKMMGRGADGGCGTEEKPFRPFRRASSKKAKGNISGTEDSCSAEISLLAQASKALCERSPFDVPEDVSTSGLSVPTLPIGLANLLKHSDSRKRHKKSHTGADNNNNKKFSRQGEKLRGGGIWAEHEEYFRSIDLPDIETLSDLSSFRTLSSRNSFSIPLLGCEPYRLGQQEIEAAEKIEDTVNANGVVGEEVKDIAKEEEVVKQDVGQPMDVDNVGGESMHLEDKPCPESDRSGYLEWVLGSRNRILLTTERPSKKRRLLGSDAGLGKLMVVHSYGGNPLLCDFCCSGDAKELHERLIVCNSCKATVHRNCYGVHEEDADKPWLCSWCKEKNDQSCERPCILCPKKGGALKPISMENGEHTEFAHLFCSQWMPELYIQDLKSMEPILNSSGIKETRKKLVCNLCKVKYGACVRCSNGACRTAFHPICAREAGNRLEIWGRHGCDTVELRAFCSKHSEIQDSSDLGSRPSLESVKEGNASDDKIAVDDIGRAGTGSDISGNSELHETESPRSKSNGSLADSVESGMSGNNNFKELALSESLSFGLILKKLIDRGKVDVKDVAADIGMSPEALSSKLTDGSLMPDLRGRIVKWLGKHAYMSTWHKGGKFKSKDKMISSCAADDSDMISGSATNGLANGSVVDEVKADKRSSVVDGEDHHEGVVPKNASRVISSVLANEMKSVHPYIRKEMTPKPESDGCEGEIKHTVVNQLSKARELGILDLSPEDEVEGELLYSQLQLLGTSVSRKQLCDKLVYEVTKKVPLEIDGQHGRRWDDVLVNKYFNDLREARKQGRKEKRHKEAQAVLAAATAAAATSSRNLLLRKDISEDHSPHEKVGPMSYFRRKAGSGSHLVPQAKETLLKMAVSGTMPSEKQSDHCKSDSSVENARCCDICRRSETIWNLILVCSNCKVAVHLDCYKSCKETTGPWYCELCREMSSSSSSARSSGPLHFWEKPLSSSADCHICGGTTGAFRKTTSGQWVHAFCAEWVLESGFRRGQLDPVQGMEGVAMNADTCCVCRQKHGACLKCNYGNCQTTFHPTCGRSAGFYMTGGGKHPRKAYCEKHGVEQKAKAETQKHGAEEMKILKQYRVGLERLRLLCERIVKREKLKREVVVSSHEILNVKKDNAVRSLHMRSGLSVAEISSDSATTSVRGHPDSNKSGSEAIQRSEDVTIDSAVSVKKRRGKGPILMDAEHKTDDSATSKTRFSRKPCNDRKTFSGKTVPRRHCIVSPCASEDADRGSKPKKQQQQQHIETFAKEVVMTSDEASVKNRRLPKGYFYVPVDCLHDDNKSAAAATATATAELHTKAGRDS